MSKGVSKRCNRATNPHGIRAHIFLNYVSDSEEQGFESLRAGQKSKSFDLDFTFMTVEHNYITIEASTSVDSFLSTSLSEKRT